MQNWTKQDIPNLSGKVFVVTGANSGIGYQTSLALAEKGASVVMACRDLDHSRSALDAIQQSAPEAELTLMALDLGSLKSIQSFAKEFRARFERLDGLINNAGPILAARTLTEDGFESHFGVGHLGHFALTAQLLDTLLATPGSRVVTVGSRMHANGKINWEDLMGEVSYDRTKAYTAGKLANMLFALELSRKLDAADSDTKSVAAHPGLAKTNWTSNLGGLMKIVANLMSNIAYQSAEMGALSILYAAVSDDAQNGGYYGPENDQKGYPMETKPADSALDQADAARLWTLSEELTGLKFAALDR